MSENISPSWRGSHVGSFSPVPSIRSLQHALADQQEDQMGLEASLVYNLQSPIPRKSAQVFKHEPLITLPFKLVCCCFQTWLLGVALAIVELAM